MSRLSRREFLKAVAVFGAAASASAFYAVFGERYLIGANYYHVPLQRLPPAFDGFKIVHLTDLHYGFLVPIEVIDWVVDRANALPKDIIVCTGDYVHRNDSARPIHEVWPSLCRLQAPLGAYAVLGNHDNWANPSVSQSWLERSGMSLRHKARLFERNGQRLWLGGTGDLWTEQQTIDEIFAGVPAQDCKIILAHNPDSADEPFQTRVDLMISGHTHGGQLRIPLIGAPLLPVKNKLYSSGLIDAPRLKLFISRGIGWAGYPVRINCPPEIAVLELKRAG